MGCAKPLEAYRGANGAIVFDRNKSLTKVPFELPCGRCMGCRLAHARTWAIRCMHEYRMCKVSEFLTLTYDDAHLPDEGTLVRAHPQLFLKRLRKRYGAGIRFYGCGEYGEASNRPHYHLLLFNYMSVDRKSYGASKKASKLYSSAVMRELWPFGNNVIGDVSFDSCSYVAGYVTKKITGEKAADHYAGRLPEFSMMSRNPGIGATWFEKYGFHSYQLGSVLYKDRELPPPRYYDTRFARSFPEALDRIKTERRRAVDKSDQSPERRAVKEEVLRLNLKKREF